MTRDPLNTLLRLRNATLDGAKQALADGLAAERRAIDAEHAARDTMRREEDAATSLDAGDGAVEAFAAWVPRGRQAIGLATVERDSRAADLVAVRAKLALARADVEAIASLLETRAAAALTEENRRSQAELDELGRGTNRASRPDGGT